MSTTKLNCPKCKHPVAWVHHSNRVRVVDHAHVTITADGVEVTCPICGAVRLVKIPEKRAA